MESLPDGYKALCSLLKIHSVSEVAKILGKSRMCLYRELKEISFLANHRSNPKNIFLSTINKGAHMKNLSILETLSAKEISALEVHDLMDLNDQVAKLLSEKIKKHIIRVSGVQIHLSLAKGPQDVLMDISIIN
jgi:hypothetical protein